MTIRSKHTLKALRSNFELIALAAILITGSDLIWVFHDMATNGVNIIYIIISSGLVLGLVSTIWVVYRHNSRLVRQFNKKLLRIKTKAVKHHLHKG